MPFQDRRVALEGSRELSAQVVNRVPLSQSSGNSGNAIARVTLADGQVLIHKRVSPEWDWLSRATGDNGRIVTMWESGVFERMPASIEHAVVGVEHDGDAWNVFMRDISHTLIDEDIRHDRATVERILSAVADMHGAFWDADIEGLCTIEERYQMLSLRTARAEKERGNPAGDLIFRAWDAFHEHASDEMAAAIAGLSADPKPLADELRTCTQTLVHGDLRLGNAGFDGDRVVLIDWGDRTGMAPPAVELGWFIGFDAKRFAVSRDDIVSVFRSLYPNRFEERALHLALIGGLVQLAAHIGLGFLDPEEAKRAAAADELEWWTRRVERAFEIWAP